MKKTIMFILIALLLVSITSSQLQIKPVIDKTKTIIELDKNTINNETADKISDVYSLWIKEKPISYVTDGIIVIIDFENTSKRIITKKERFDKLIVEDIGD